MFVLALAAPTGCERSGAGVDLACLDSAGAIVSAASDNVCSRYPDLIVGPGGGDCETVDETALRSGRPATCSLPGALAYARQRDPSDEDAMELVVLGHGGPGACDDVPAAVRTPATLTVINHAPGPLRLIGCGVRLEVTSTDQPVLDIRDSLGPVVVRGFVITGGDAAAIAIGANRNTVRIEDTDVSGAGAGIRVTTGAAVFIERSRIGPTAGTALATADVAELTLRNVELLATAGAAALVERAGAVLLEDASVTAAGAATDGLVLSGLHGTVRIVRGAIRGSNGHSLVLAGDRGAAGLEMRDSDVIYDGERDGRGGISVTAANTAAVTIRLRNTRLRGRSGTAFQATAGDQSRLRIDIRRASISGGESGIDLAVTDDATLALELTDSDKIGDIDGDLLSFFAGGRARVEASIAGARLAGSRQGSGIRLTLVDDARARVRIADTVVEDIRTGAGVEALAWRGSGVLDIEIRDSRVELSAQARDGILISAGADPQDESTVCVDLAGNAVRAGDDRPGIRLRQVGGARLVLKKRGAGEPPLALIDRKNRSGPRPAVLEGRTGEDKLRRCPG